MTLSCSPLSRAPSLSSWSPAAGCWSPAASRPLAPDLCYKDEIKEKLPASPPPWSWPAPYLPEAHRPSLPQPWPCSPVRICAAISTIFTIFTCKYVFCNIHNIHREYWVMAPTSFFSFELSPQCHKLLSSAQSPSWHERSRCHLKVLPKLKIWC